MKILVVDDEPAIRFSLAELLEADGHEVREAAHAPAALAALEADGADLVVSDLTMPAMDGLQLLEEVRARHPGTLFVLMTAHGDERTAVRALRDVQRVIRRAGPTDATVLVTGESGTGKEVAARALHAESRRRGGPFVALNCSALPAELVESELFGHVKGAFTGADRDREGMFEAAQRGTLFLDEIGDLAPPAQAKLLRALEERQVTRLGSTRPTGVDVRVVAATNRPLEKMAAEGAFRDDLLYRLRVIALHLPPLRERREDVLPIAHHFLAEMAARHGRRIEGFGEDARRALLAYDWPGNVRELRNAVERAVVLAEGATIEAADLPPQLKRSTAPLRPVEAALAGLPFAEARDRAVEAFERGFLEAALERHGGNVSATARALGLHRQSLQKKLRQLGLAQATGG